MTGVKFGSIPDVVSFSPDGALVAAGAKEGGLLLCNRDGELLTAIPKAHEDVVRAVRFSNDGTRLATVSDDRTLRLWSIPDLHPLKIYRGHGLDVFTVAFSQDDQRLVTSGYDGKSKIWDLRADLDFAPRELAGFSHATYSPGGDVIAGTADSGLVIWQGRTGRRLHTLEGHGQVAKTVALNASGTLVASIGQESEGETLRIWDVNSGELLHHLPTGLKNSDAIDFVLDDTQLLIGAGKDVVQFNREAQTFTPLLGEAFLAELAPRNTPSYRVSPGGDQVVICFQKKESPFQATLLKLTDGAEVAKISVEGVNALQGYFTGTPETLFLAREDFNADGKGIDHGSISLWDTTAGTLSEPAFTFEDGTETHETGIASPALSPDGTLVVTGDKQGRTALWQFDGQSITSPIALRGHTGSIDDMAFSPDGNRLVTGSFDRTFNIWDVTNGSLITTLQEAAVLADLEVARPTQVAFSPDGLQLATITEPPVSPMILHAFSTNMADYPEVTLTEDEAKDAYDPELTVLEKRMEAYKQAYRNR